MVDKVHRGTEATRARVPDEFYDHLLRWYTGQGSADDERVGIELVRSAREHARWFACECLGRDVHPPLLSPAYMAEAQTFYLRRLTGAERPAHLPACPFFRDQVTGIDRTLGLRPAYAVPDGFFSVLKPIGEHLAQAAEPTPPRPRAPSVPRLARLLWLLVERAGTNVVESVTDRQPASIAAEFRRVREAAAGLMLAPTVPLARLLFTHADDLHRKVIYARLRAAAETWPAGHEPQAFLLMFARHVGTREIITADGVAVTVATDIARPPKTEGPFLVIVAIGFDPVARGYAPLRAYAQPILDGHHFLPVTSSAERQLAGHLLALQRPLHRNGIDLRLKKPVFDIVTEFGPCRPQMMVEIARDDGMPRMKIVELGGLAEDDDWLALASLGEMVSVDPAVLDDAGVAPTALAAAIIGSTPSDAVTRAGDATLAEANVA